jgi:hypothetical protein
MVLAIEPMINAGGIGHSARCRTAGPVVTAAVRSAHFEQTVAGTEVLTAPRS